MPTIREESASRLRQEFAATRVGLTWLGVRKSLTSEQKARAADGFDAEVRFLSATKKLLDTQHPRFRAVTALKGRIVGYWKGLTLPYPEPGLRLIRQSVIPEFDGQLRTFQSELQQQVTLLDDHYAELRRTARDRLGQLFSEADYPVSLKDEFEITWDFPSVEPPGYLLQLNPRLYQQECQRMQARFDEAVQLTEQMFFDELSKLVSHLTERLTGREDGKAKVFRDSAIENLLEFFGRFRTLSVHSSAELDQLVERAKDVLSGVQPQDLRDSAARRQQVASQMAAVQATLEGLLIDRPRRSIVRPGTARSGHADRD
ncbi:hypothetical protein Pan44_39160 [Caulifigura coniformis]|uniref:Uncharacterized protein n=1 Tax=Caulifigura coniformis TaxID=2527983 RepID=A0A517SIB9_9PLAN|nr:hypothetical protein [Caulifigura coniformis]QDT55868.1 hypothetical protein Pan44_39160 [Caulifigura coniformis]